MLYEETFPWQPAYRLGQNRPQPTNGNEEEPQVNSLYMEVLIIKNDQNAYQDSIRSDEKNLQGP